MVKPDKRLKYHKPVGNRHKRRAFAILIRSPELTSAFLDKFDPAAMPYEDQVQMLAWKVASDYYREYEEVITNDVLVEGLDDVLDNEPELLDEDGFEDLGKFMDLCYDGKLELKTRWATNVLRAYLRNVVAETIARNMFNNETSVQNPGAYLEEAQNKLLSLESVGSNFQPLVYHAGWEERKLLVTQKTSMPFFDAFMEGGQAAGEVYGVMAPYGTCKTTLVVQMAVNQARACYRKYRKQIRKGVKNPIFEYVVLLSYEEDENAMRERITGFGAEIPRHRLKVIRSRADYSNKPTNMFDYEKDLQIMRSVLGTYGGINPREAPEWDRVMMLVPAINKHILSLNALNLQQDGLSTRLSQSTLGVGDVRMRIEQKNKLLAAEGITRAKPRVIYVDFVNAAVQIGMDAREMGADELRTQINAFPLRVRNTLAMPYACPVWLMQQFTGAVQGLPPTRRLHHSEAAECKSFGQYLNFCFTIGNKDENERVLLAMTKSRRAASKSDMVLQIDGNFNRVYWLNDFVVDQDQGIFRPRDEDELDGISEDTTDFVTGDGDYPGHSPEGVI